MKYFIFLNFLFLLVPNVSFSQTEFEITKIGSTNLKPLLTHTIFIGKNINHPENSFVENAIVIMNDGTDFKIKSEFFHIEYDCCYLADKPFLRGYLKGIEKYFLICSKDERKKEIITLQEILKSYTW